MKTIKRPEALQITLILRKSWRDTIDEAVRQHIIDATGTPNRTLNRLSAIRSKMGQGDEVKLTRWQLGTALACVSAYDKGQLDLQYYLRGFVKTLERRVG